MIYIFAERGLDTNQERQMTLAVVVQECIPIVPMSDRFNRDDVQTHG